MKKGLLIVFSGPSGVGKGSILKEVTLDESLKLVYSVSMTTRKAREGEKEGVNYFFVTKERFLEAIQQEELLEYAEFVGNYYGTPMTFVEEERNKGHNVLLEIEVEGAKQVMEKVKDCVSIFIVPPSIEELEKRIRGRKTETEETIAKRVQKARHELKESSLYKYVVCNDTIPQAASEVIAILRKEIEEK